MKLSGVFQLAILSAVALAKVSKYTRYGDGGIYYYACAYELRREATICKKKGYACYCSSEIGIASFAGCLAQSGKDTTELYDYWMDYCQKYYTPTNLTAIEKGYEYYKESALYTSEMTNFNKSVPITVPLKIREKNYKIITDTYKVFLGNFDHSLFYGAGCMGFWALVILIATVVNWTTYLFPQVFRMFDGPISRAWRKYVTLPALMRRKRSESQSFLFVFDFLVPSRLETVTMILFLGLCIGSCAAEIYITHGQYLFKSEQVALTRFISDRTGIICTILTPLLVLLGGRNNFVQFLTRWKFSTVLMYHRWIARVVVLMAFIHGVGYSVIFVINGKYAAEMAENYLIWGVVAVTCGCLILGQGLLFLRRRWYETFLVIHILLAVFFIVGLWYHVWELGYAQFVYPCFAVWGFDRLVRLVRIAMFGTPDATVSLVADETITVTIKRPSYWKVIPGGHAWIHFGKGYFFWQSHPFTLVETDDNNIKFYCKVKGGVTKSIAKKLSKVPGKTMTMKVGVEGPYGETKSVKGHSNLVFLAGGSGIPGLYCEATHFAKKGAASNQVVKLVWIIREFKSLAWFWSELQALKDTKIQTTIYVTRYDSDCGSEDLLPFLSCNESDKAEKNSTQDSILEEIEAQFPHITFIAGRPAIEELVKSEIAEAAHSVAFVSCGHPAMVDEVRYNVVKQVDQSKKRVDFYDALEVWA